MIVFEEDRALLLYSASIHPFTTHEDTEAGRWQLHAPGADRIRDTAKIKPTSHFPDSGGSVPWNSQGSLQARSQFLGQEGEDEVKQGEEISLQPSPVEALHSVYEVGWGGSEVAEF